MTRNYLRGVLAAAVLLLSVGTVVYGQSADISCLPTVVHSDVARINALTIEGKNYVTHGSKGYHDWTHVVNIPFTAGTKYPIRMQPRYFKGDVTVYWKVWIDYNMDGDFDDLYEYTCYGKGTGSVMGNLNIPKDVWNGETTMRVAISTDHYPSMPCDYIESGEVEDYKVTITDGTATVKKNIPRGGLYVYMPTKAKDTKTDKKIKAKKASKEKSKSDLTVITRNEKPAIKDYKLSVYPNPSIYYSILKLDLDGENQAVDNIIITDISGRRISQLSYMHMSNTTYRINTQSIAGGVYNVTAYVGDQAYSTKLLVAK